MKYTVNAYVCTNFAGLMDRLETDFWNEVEEFIWDNVQKGFNCEVIDNETGNRNIAYADDFTNEACENPMEMH